MTTYNTGNPIGSTSVKDLYDNAENLDHLVNDPIAESWPDRLGVPRKTWHGIESQAQIDINQAANQAAEAATEQSEEYRDEAELARNLAEDARDQAQAAAMAVGPIYKFYDTYAAALADIANIPANALVDIAADETMNGVTTRRRKQGAVLNFVMALNSFLQKGSGSVVRKFDEKLQDVLTSKDKGVVAGAADQSAPIASTIAAGGVPIMTPGIVNCESRVPAAGKRLEFEPGFRAYSAANSSQDLAHAQVMPSGVMHDSYDKYDASRFWRIGPIVMTYGDSNTAWVDQNGRIGTGQGSWPAYLDAYLAQHTFYSEGRPRGDGSPGQTSAWALENLGTFLTLYGPQITVLGWGTNDIADGTTLETYISNMAQLIERLHATGNMVIVLGIPWHSVNYRKSQAWNASLLELCRNYNCTFIPVYSLFANATATYFATDGVHYTAAANQIIAKLVGDAIIENYGLPRSKMQSFSVAKTGAGTTQWECNVVRNTYGNACEVVQTPDPYVRRIFPNALKITAGQQIQFAAAGPFTALFSWPDSMAATWTLNGGAYSPNTRGSVVKVGNVSPRLDGSAANFRVGASAGTIYFLGAFAENDPGEYVPNSTEIRNSLYTPGKITKVSILGRILESVLDPVVGGVEIGRHPGINVANIGPRATRTAITSAPQGFLFMESDNELLFEWTGATWQAILS